jgi:hypothetical protein
MEVRSAAMHAAAQDHNLDCLLPAVGAVPYKAFHHLSSVYCAQPCRREARGLVHLAVVRISICLSKPTMPTYAKATPYGSCTAIGRFSDASAIGVSIQGFEEG